MINLEEKLKMGLSMEEQLKPLIERVLGVSLRKTASAYDLVDFEGEDEEGRRIVVEVKSRRHKNDNGYIQRREAFGNWLFPTHKEKALKEAFQSYIVYYWDTDKSVWLLHYQKEVFAEIEKDVPPWHRQYQEHWYIPHELFRPIGDHSVSSIASATA